MAERPAAVEWAYRLMLVRAALFVAVVAYGLARVDDHVARASGQDLFTDVTSVVVLGLLLAFVGVAFYVVVAVLLRRGHRWARVAAWVYSGVGILVALIGVLGGVGPVTAVLDVVAVVLDAAVIVLLAQRSTGSFLAVRRGAS